MNQVEKYLALPKDLSHEEMKAHWNALTENEKKEVERISKARHFVPENANTENVCTHESPSGDYLLKITPFSTRPGCWNYTQGLVFKKGEKIPLFEVQRNYSSFPFLFVEDHPNGHSYMVCGEDYQGQTILELDTGKRVDYVPQSANEGFGFCWVHYTASPDKRTLAVDGCYWACPYEIWFVDFSEPMKAPLLVLERVDHLDKMFGWVGPSTAEIGLEYEIYKATGKKEHEVPEEILDEEERAIAANEKKYGDVWETKKEKILWERPSPEQAAKKYISYLEKGWLTEDRPISKEILEMGFDHLKNIPESERAALWEKLSRAKILE